MINFLIEDTKTIKHYFIDHASIGHHKERSSVRLYTMDEIYHLIEHVVENVHTYIHSYNILKICIFAKCN